MLFLELFSFSTTSCNSCAHNSGLTYAAVTCSTICAVRGSASDHHWRTSAGRFANVRAYTQHTVCSRCSLVDDSIQHKYNYFV